MGVLTGLWFGGQHLYAQNPSDAKQETLLNFRKLQTVPQRMDFIRKHFADLPQAETTAWIDPDRDPQTYMYWYYTQGISATVPEKRAQNFRIVQQIAQEKGFRVESLVMAFQSATIAYASGKTSEQQNYPLYLKMFEDMKRLGIRHFYWYTPDWILFEMGRLFYELGDDEKATEALTLSETYAQDNPFSKMYHVLTLNLIQAIFARKKDFAHAITYAQKIHDYSEVENRTYPDWRHTFWMGLSQLDIATYLLEQGKPQESEAYAQRGYAMANIDYNIHDPYENIFHKLFAEFDALQTVIRVKLRLHKTAEATPLLQRSEVLRPLMRFQDPGNYFRILPLYSNWAEFHAQQHHFEQAFHYQSLAREMEDSLARRNDKRKLSQIEMRVNAERYQSQIKSAEADSQLQQKLRNFAIAALVLVIMAALWVYRRIKRDTHIIIRQKELLETSLSEKEILLKEVHHRVKNNLQIISALFDKQAQQTDDEMTQKLMREGQDRVFSIALVHQNLYQNENLSQIEMTSYLQMLLQNIEKSQRNRDQHIEIQLNVDDSFLDIDAAIPLGLILNELLTNCYKYAFRGRNEGRIEIAYAQVNRGVFLDVRDNGVGLPKDFKPEQTKSLGLNLVRGLVRQLDGKLSYQSNEAGSSFSVYFRR